MDMLFFALATLIKVVIGVPALLISYKLFDWITDWKFREVLKDEKITGGSIVVASFLLGMSIVIAFAAF